MKNSIKRAQSQACLGFAERKNFRPLAKLKKLSLMLVALLSMTAGAWAQNSDEVTVTPVSGQTNKWTFQMPASNVELQVEYYAESNLFLGKEALADKTNIAVKNGETAVAFGEDGKSTTTVTEGNTVTAKFTGKKVLGMKVAKKAANVHSITIAVDPSTNDPKATAPAMTIEFKTGETWADVAARYDWLDTYETHTVFYKDDILNGDVHDANGGVTPDKTIDPNGSYHWGM